MKAETKKQLTTNVQFEQFEMKWSVVQNNLYKSELKLTKRCPRGSTAILTMVKLFKIEIVSVAQIDI